jgi:hypothetical protein
VLVNGTPFGRIIHSRGLRQGDPLSPYLFLLVAKGLSSLLLKAKSESDISRVSAVACGTRLSHLFFADDSLLFCMANSLEWNNLSQVLQVYEKALGHKLNAAKTSIFFSKNTPTAFRTSIRSSSGVSVSASFEKYLGLPALVG